MARQFSLLKCEVQYGGTHTKGKAKTRRPLSTRKPIHATMRSSKALGSLSLIRYRVKIQKLMDAQAQSWGVRIYQSSINSNHIHMVLRGTSLGGLRNFFRVFAGLTARLVTRAEKGRPFGKFWDETVWTRVAEWGQAFRALKGYIVRNVLESTEQIVYDRRIRTVDILRV